MVHAYFTKKSKFIYVSERNSDLTAKSMIMLVLIKHRKKLEHQCLTVQRMAAVTVTAGRVIFSGT